MCLREMLLLGAILRYIPCGIAAASPVGILTIVCGCIVIDVIELTSYPIDPGVALVGSIAVALHKLLLPLHEEAFNASPTTSSKGSKL